jgi:hypothetical protein
MADHDGFDEGAYDAHYLRIHRDAWRYFCDLSGMHPQAFLRRVRARLPAYGIQVREWIDAAEDAAEAAARARTEAQARREGYSRDLERRWAEEVKLLDA